MNSPELHRNLPPPSPAWAGALSRRAQCRLVTTDAPSDALASRDLGGAVAVELWAAPSDGSAGNWLIILLELVGGLELWEYS